MERRIESLNTWWFSIFFRKLAQETCSELSNIIPDESRIGLVLRIRRVVVENTFGRLKSHFQCIAKGLDTTLEQFVAIVTCFILHNFCIITKQRFLHEWLQQTEVGLVQNRNTSRCLEVLNEAESIRSGIRDYLAHLWSLFLNVFVNKRTITVNKCIFKSPKGKGKDNS